MTEAGGPQPTGNPGGKPEEGVSLFSFAADSLPLGADSVTRVRLATFLKVGAGAPPVVADKTLRALRKKVISTSVAKTTTGMVTVNVRTQSLLVSLKIAEPMLEALNHFNLITRQSQAREERRFTDGRLDAARGSLRATEDELQWFLQTNRQLESPALTFQRDRLQREVTLQQQVVASLAQQSEENRIREVRPARRGSCQSPLPGYAGHLGHRGADPHRAPRCAAPGPDPHPGTAAAFCVSLLIVIVREAWTRESTIGRDSALALRISEWNRLGGVAAS